MSSVFAKGATLSPRHTFALLQRKYKLFIQAAQSVPHPGQTPALGAWLCRAGTDGNLSLVIMRRCQASEQDWWAGKGLCLVRISVWDRGRCREEVRAGQGCKVVSLVFLQGLQSCWAGAHPEQSWSLAVFRYRGVISSPCFPARRCNSGRVLVLSWRAPRSVSSLGLNWLLTELCRFFTRRGDEQSFSPYLQSLPGCILRGWRVFLRAGYWIIAIPVKLSCQPSFYT